MTVGAGVGVGVGVAVGVEVEPLINQASNAVRTFVGRLVQKSSEKISLLEDEEELVLATPSVLTCPSMVKSMTSVPVSQLLAAPAVGSPHKVTTGCHTAYWSAGTFTPERLRL